MMMRAFAWAAVAMAMCGPALADPVSAPAFSVGTGGSSVAGTVPMGLDAVNKAWPCGSVQVVFGCAASGAAVVTAPVPSSPTDFSANAAAVPLPGLVLLATIPANAARYACEVQNQSTATIQLVRDDGTANASSIMLGAGSTTGAQGAGWSSTTFKGRVRIYGAAGARVSAFQE